jgi:hypothetical protein
MPVRAGTQPAGRWSGAGAPGHAARIAYALPNVSTVELWNSSPWKG